MQKKINRKKVVIIFLLILLITTSAIMFILAKYKSSATNEEGVNIAYYIVDGGIQTENFMLDAIAPNSTPYVYTIKVANNKDGKVAETVLNYTLKFKTTTNLPLTYNLYLKEEYDENGTLATTQIQNQETIQEDEVYYYTFDTTEKEIGLEETTDIYTLVVTFPEQYKVNLEYMNILEYLKITIDSKQKV